MKTNTTLFAILLVTILSGCGGGGGGSSQSQESNPAVYTVSTLSLNGYTLNQPAGITVDANGDLYVADAGANLILKIALAVNNTANVNTVLGGGGTDYSFCLSSALDAPSGVVLDSDNHLYVTETNKALVRYADCTVAPGSSAQYGSPDASLTLSSPGGLAIHGSRLYVADTGNHIIRRITDNGAHSGTTTTFAGTSNGYVNGSSGIAAFSQPTGVAVTSTGKVFVADTNNCAIRMIASGRVSTFAGSLPNATCGSVDGTQTNARFDHPTGLAVDKNDNLYVADTTNNMIRRITPQGVVTTIAGSGSAGTGDGVGTSATFNAPTSLVVGPSGHIFVVDAGSSTIRKITVTH